MNLWWLGAFSGVAQAKYDHLLRITQAVGAEWDHYQQQTRYLKRHEYGQQRIAQADRPLLSGLRAPIAIVNLGG